jgi:hypothetical protein
MTKKLHALLFSLVSISWVSFMAGCGEPSIGTVPVTGTVKVDGQPMEGVSITFHPDGSGRAASGKSDAQGNFKLTTIIAGDGALPGKYKVSASKHENPSDDLPKDVDPNDPKSMDAIYGKLDTKKKVKSKNLLAPMYENPAGSGLAGEVSASGKNHFDFELKGGKK